MISCSNNGLSVEDTSWYCRSESSIRICDVKFTVENANHFPIVATVVIRAHQRGNKRSREAANRITPAKELAIVLEAGKVREFQEVFEGAGRLRRFIVTTYGERKV